RDFLVTGVQTCALPISTSTFPVFNGTGANVVGLTALLHRWDAVVTSEHAHLATDESTAPQLVGGMAVRTLPAPAGKLTPAGVSEIGSASWREGGGRRRL